MFDEEQSNTSKSSWLQNLLNTATIAALIALFGTIYQVNTSSSSDLRLKRLEFELSIIAEILSETSQIEDGSEQDEAKLQEIAGRIRFLIDVGAIEELNTEELERYADNPELLPTLPSIPVSVRSGFPLGPAFDARSSCERLRIIEADGKSVRDYLVAAGYESFQEAIYNDCRQYVPDLEEAIRSSDTE